MCFYLMGGPVTWSSDNYQKKGKGHDVRESDPTV